VNNGPAYNLTEGISQQSDIFVDIGSGTELVVVDIGSGIELADFDSVNSIVTVQNVTVEIIGGSSQETLSFNYFSPLVQVSKELIFVITVHDPVSHCVFNVQVDDMQTVMRLNGTAELEVYQTILESLSYGLAVDSEPPCPLQRSIQITIYHPT